VRRRSFWPRCLAPLLCRLAVHTLNPRLAAASRPGWLRELSVTRASLGAAPPRLSNVRVRLLEAGAAAELTLRLDYAAGRDLRLRLDAVVAPALRIPLHASRLALSGDLRVCVGGLSPAFPWVSLLRVAFTAPPEVELAVSALGAGAAAVPGASRWLQGFVASALRAHAVEPAAPVLHLAARLGDAAPKARLSVAVHDARRLPLHAGADPFVRCALHGAAAETGVRRRGRDPRFGGQLLSFDVLSWEKARLRIDVLAWRPRGVPLHLATCLLDLRSARVCDGLRGDGSPLKLTLRLALPGPGPDGVAAADAAFAPGAAGELDIVLRLTDHSRPDAPAPPPSLPAFAEPHGDAAGDVHAVPQLKARAPDAADVPIRSGEGVPLRLDELEAMEAEEARLREHAAAAAAVAAMQPTQPAQATQATQRSVADEATQTEPEPEAEPAALPPADGIATMEAAEEAVAEAEQPAAPPEADAAPAGEAEAGPPSSDDPSPSPPSEAAQAQAQAAFVSPFAAPNASAPPPRFLLDVTVHRAEELVASVESDPYARLSLGPSFAETGVRRRMVDPDFNDQRFTLRCRGWGDRAATLRLQALGWLPRGAEPVPLGAATLQLREALLDGRLVADEGVARPFKLALQGVPHGALLVSLAVRHLAEPPPSAAPEEAPEEVAPPVKLGASSPSQRGFNDVEIQLNVPGWAKELERDVLALAATADEDAQQAARQTIARRASAPARHL